MKQLLFLLSFLIIINSLHAQLVFERQHIDDLSFAISVVITDINGDQQPDIFGTAHSHLQKWYENTGNNEFIPHETNITLPGVEEEGTFFIDMDGDQDIDFVACERAANNIVWYENDGFGEFERHEIDTTANAPWSVYAADMDGDMDIDVLCASNFSKEILYLEKINSSNSFIKHTIADDFKYATSVVASDIDGDGDLDILGGAAHSSSSMRGVIWWENNGAGSFPIKHIIANTISAESVAAFDADNDGDMDVLSSSSYQDEIILWVNNGNQTFTNQTIVEDYDGAESVFTVDLDLDGDLDILAAGYWQSDVHWWKNDGAGNFTIQTIGTDYQGSNRVHAADIDNDGDIDIATANLPMDDISIWINETVTTSSIELSNEVPVQVFPNPAASTLTVKSLPSQIRKLAVYNQSGQLVYNVETAEEIIDLSGWESGIYYLNIETQESSYSKMILVF